MPHVAICGGSTCGKTTLAQVLAAEYLKNGIPVFVLSARKEHWPCSQMVHSIEELNAWIDAQKAANAKREKPQRLAVFIDDAGQTIDKWDKRFHYYATDARHDHIRSHFLVQAGPQIPPIVRDNCETLFLFRCGVRVAQLWYDQFVHQELIDQCTTLQQYEFLKVTKFGRPERQTLKL